MINNTRRGTFTVAAVAVGVILAGGVAGASALGAGPLAVADTTTTLDTTTTVGDTSTTADPSTTIETSTTLDGSTTTEVATTLPEAAAPTTVETTVPDTRGPDPTGPAAHGLCTAFAKRAGQPGNSQAWARLNEQAGGDIQGWCAAVLADTAAKHGHDHSAEPGTTEPHPSTSLPAATQKHVDQGQGSGHAQTNAGRAAAGANGATGGNSKGHGKG